ATTVVVGPRAVTSYANHTGAVRWSRPTGTVPQAWQVDGGELYMAVASGGYLGSAPVTALRRISLSTGAQHVVHSHGPSFLGALTKAWGFGIAAQQVLWTSRPLPWPHYFVDLSGIGGSAPPGQDAVLLAICGRVAAQAAGATVPRCTRPELAVLNR